MSVVAMQAQLPLDVESQPALIVLGRDDSNKPHASWFGADEIDAARAAAKAMGMMALAVDTPEVVSLAGRLPHGKIFGSGKAFVPFVKQALFEDLIIHVPFVEQVRPLRVVRAEAEGDGAAAPTPPENGTSNDGSAVTVPQDWSKVGPGCLVLAVADDASEGWFETVILKAKGNTAFVCRWRDYPAEPHFERPLAGLALMRPSRVQSV
ncbi:hypothetical protein DEVEQU_00467 [Devosia equisanguinis]|uniref:Uncharacterized protein n=1 Tax=Devosia equisanguinis TaxID=2490941 RepID=A0A3S4CBF7_9HYPH|nr:hypothetical protein [Devosia equisanguinis]VDS03346.1 hypothetical protein DEVEQU_00467 [Devosia equisanguinis]